MTDSCMVQYTTLAIDNTDVNMHMRLPALLGTMYANGGIPLKHNPDGSVAVATEPRPTQVFDGKEYVMEYALRPDVSLVKAWKADTRGNLIFRGTSQNANPDCAVAGKVVLVSRLHSYVHQAYS